MASRTIVVGAGVLGLSVAERLAAKGDEVVLLDRGEPGGGTSRTTFAWLNSNSKAPPTYQRLNVEGVDRYRELVGLPDTTTWLHLTGRIEWGVGAAEAGGIERAVEAMRAQDYPVEALTVEAARRLEPDLLIPDEAQVWLWPSEGFVIPPLYLAWLEARARSRGVEVGAGREVVGFELHGGRVRGVRIADGTTLRADRVVTCVGRWTETLLAQLDVHVPMLPAVRGGPAMGQLGYSTPVRTRLTRTISTPRMSVRPDTPAGRYVLQGHGQDRLAEPGSQPDPDGEVGREILSLARSILAGFGDARLDELRVGYRSVPADRVTVAGWAPGVENLYTIATHSAYTLALHLGELAAREVASGTNEATLDDFRPDRFAAPVEAAVAESRLVH